MSPENWAWRGHNTVQSDTDHSARFSPIRTPPCLSKFLQVLQGGEADVVIYLHSLSTQGDSDSGPRGVFWKVVLQSELLRGCGGACLPSIPDIGKRVPSSRPAWAVQ